MSGHLRQHEAQKKRFKEIVILVPFYGATHKQLRRHVEFLNEVGFDVAYVDLDFSIDWKNPPISSKMGFGLKHVWSDQIEDVINRFDGDKIVFAFSNPAAGAIEAIARRGARDIKALICDSGPSHYPLKSVWRLQSQNRSIVMLPFTALKSAVGYALIFPQFSEELAQDLAIFPVDFPILSIRGWRDQIIPSSYIDDAFEPHSHLAWQKLSLPGAEHLNGLKDFASEYKPPVESFLRVHSKAI